VPEHRAEYPFAIKVAAGKINAVTGQPWSDGLHHNPQDYMVVPPQPWLDGYCISKGLIRQFVAMALGQGFTAEEQITGQAEHGGLQIIVYPMKSDSFERYHPRRWRDEATVGIPRGLGETPGALPLDSCAQPLHFSRQMGLAPGGRMKQEIYKDP